MPVDVPFFIDRSNYYQKNLECRPGPIPNGTYQEVILDDVHKQPGYETVEAFLCIGSDQSTNGPAFRRPTPGIVRLEYYDRIIPGKTPDTLFGRIPRLRNGAIGFSEDFHCTLGQYLFPGIAPPNLAELEKNLNPPGYPPSYDHLQSPDEMVRGIDEYVRNGRITGTAVPLIPIRDFESVSTPRLLVVDEVQLPVLEVLAREGYRLQRIN